MPTSHWRGNSLTGVVVMVVVILSGGSILVCLIMCLDEAMKNDNVCCLVLKADMSVRMQWVRGCCAGNTANHSLSQMVRGHCRRHLQDTYRTCQDNLSIGAMIRLATQQLCSPRGVDLEKLIESQGSLKGQRTNDATVVTSKRSHCHCPPPLTTSQRGQQHLALLWEMKSWSYSRWFQSGSHDS